MQQELAEVYFYIKGTLKYKRVAVLFALLVCICGWAYVSMMPEQFESKAKVHIDSSTVLRPLMRGMVIEPDVSTLIRVIQELMFTRPNLEKIIELSQLKSSVKAGSVIDNEFIEKLKKDIKIKGAGTKDIFDISYSATDPDVAKSVVQAVLTVFSEQTQGKALADADDAQRFIEQQIRDYEIRLQEAERAKEEFKRKNLDLLANGTSQFDQLGDLKAELEKAMFALDQSLARRNVLSEQIKNVQDSDEEWGVTDLAGEVSEEDARIAALNDKKTEMLIKYTEKHPAVQAIDRLIESLQVQKEQNKKRAISEANYIGPQKMSNPYVQTLKTAYDNAEAEVASNQALINSIKNKIARIEQDLSARLAIETEMKNLNRDYETISGQYAQLLQRREQARITERVDDQASRLKFKIADPPTKPTEPSFPNRPLFYSLVLVVGIVMGFALAFLIYFIRPVFMSTRQVRLVTGLPSLGSISLTSQGLARVKHVDWVLLLTIIVLISSYSGIMLFELNR